MNGTAPSHIAARRVKQTIAFGLFRLAAVVVVLALGGIVAFVLYQGWGVISWEFLSQFPREEMTKGGILPCLLGTLCLTLGALLTALPLGVATAVYLSEYAQEGKVLAVVRLGVQNLAGVPSVVFGLFGAALFVALFGFRKSILSGSLTLGLLILPTIVGAAEEALRQVPATFREASLGLGATRWQTIWRVVLPAALPGILTGGILGLGRAAGETAPIMFTAAAFATGLLPTSIFDEVMALPYHIYVLATAGTRILETRPIQYGTVLVL
ncbi:MAG: phosphate ABC transporter permease PstA, partial [Thermodesulfobacteriota bacterium]